MSHDDCDDYVVVWSGGELLPPRDQRPMSYDRVWWSEARGRPNWRRELSGEDCEAIRQAHARGWSGRRISHEYDIGHQRVNGYLRRLRAGQCLE